MLRNVIAAGDFGPAVLEWINVASLAIEILAADVVRTVALEATFET